MVQYRSWRNGDPQSFRPPFGKMRKAVKGGRWKVRRVSISSHGRRWRAWTEGNAKYFNRYFHTHGEAIDWAQRVARAWGSNDIFTLTDLQKQKYPKIGLGVLIQHRGRRP